MNTAPASQKAQPPSERGLRPPSAHAARRWLREPLVHFLALGLALFAVYGAFNRGPAQTPQSRQIVLTLDDLRQLQIGFASQWQRPPTQQEMVGLLEDKIRQEILYREALAMGLDKDDTIVKRRMAQKMEFLARGRRERPRADLRRAEGLVREEHPDVRANAARHFPTPLFFP